MNLFGIGNLELFAILIVMLLVLGPARMVDLARQAGKWWRDSQRFLRTMADAATVKLDENPSSNAPPRDPVDGPEDAVARGLSDETPVDGDEAVEVADDSSATR